MLRPSDIEADRARLDASQLSLLQLRHRESRLGIDGGLRLRLQIQRQARDQNAMLTEPQHHGGLSRRVRGATGMTMDRAAVERLAKGIVTREVIDELVALLDASGDNDAPAGFFDEFIGREFNMELVDDFKRKMNRHRGVRPDLGLTRRDA